MEDNKLAARIRPLEALAAANPGGYRFRVALVALLRLPAAYPPKLHGRRAAIAARSHAG